MAYSSSGVAVGINELASALLSIGNNQQVYLYKDSNGVIQANVLEQYTNTNNFGYAYNFISGDVVYSSTPVLNVQSIPWDYTSSVLTAISANLWDTKLTLWLDAKESKSVSSSLQKMVSKGYNTVSNFIENTNDYSFTYGTDVINMTNYSNLESSVALTQKQYFKVGIVCEIGTQNVTDKVIFKHNDFEIKIGQETVADTSTQYCIGLYDNGTFCKGVTFKPSDLTFKYFIYCDNSSALEVSGNVAAGGSFGSFSYGSDYKVYINDDSTHTKSAAIKFYECLYFQSTANDISATKANMWDYFSARWTLTTYSDAFNVVPITADFALLSDAGNIGWTNMTYQPTATYISKASSGLTLSISNRKATFVSSSRTSEHPLPLSVSNTINCDNAFAAGSKYYFEMEIVLASNAIANGGIGICSVNTTRFDVNTMDGNASHDNTWIMDRTWGSTWSSQWNTFYKNGTSALTGPSGNNDNSFTDRTVATKIGCGIDFSNGSTILFSIYNNGTRQYTVNMSSSNIQNGNGHIITPCIYHYGATQYSFEYQVTPSYLPTGHTYIS